MKHIHDWAIMPAAGLFAAFILVTTSAAPLADDGEDKRDGRDTISQSTVQQGFAASPIPKDRLKLDGKNPAMVALGSYLVNGPGDCSGCHSLPRFLRPAGTVPVTGNPQHNYTGQGSNPNYGDPFQDPPDQTLTTQLKANYNTAHYLAGGRCFGAIQSRNLTPDDSGRPRGLTEAEFIQVMRTGKDVSCKKATPPIYGGKVDGVCDMPDPPGAGVTYNVEVLQTMPWPSYHNMTDADLKAIYAYLSAVPQTTACNTPELGCFGFKDPNGNPYPKGPNPPAFYAYPNTDDCPNPPPP